MDSSDSESNLGDAVITDLTLNNATVKKDNAPSPSAALAEETSESKNFDQEQKNNDSSAAQGSSPPDNISEERIVDAEKDGVAGAKKRSFELPTEVEMRIYQVQIQNLPKFYGMKQLKNILKKLDVHPKKLVILHQHAFATFQSEEDQLRAIKTIHGHTFRGKNLVAKAETAFLTSKGKVRSIENVGSEKQSDSTDVLSPEQRMLNAVTPLREMPYGEQLKLKQAESKKLLTSLSKQIRFSSPHKLSGEHYGKLEDIRASPRPVGYRNKCEFTIGYSVDGQKTVGFQASGFERGKNYVLNPSDCCHISDTMKRCVGEFNRFLDSSDKPPFSQESNEGYWRMLTLRSFQFDLMMIVTVHPQNLSPEELNEMKQTIVVHFSDANNWSRGFRITSIYFQKQVATSDKEDYQLLFGAPYIYENLFGTLRFRVSPGAFYQTNSKSAEVLYRTVGDICGADKETVLLDVCCGTGTIGISLADRVRFVLGVEICKEAVKDAEINARSNRKTNCKFVAGAAEEVFPEIHHHVPESVGLNRVVGILDPPRAGLGDKTIGCIRRMECLNRLVYVSCDPKGASKNFVDLCRITSNRYAGIPFRLETVVPVDMCPQTKLCEWIMLFCRE